MKKTLSLLLLCCISLPLAADAAKAKKKLERDGYPLTVERFHSAIFLGEAKVVALYLEAGMPADAANDKGLSAIHKAAALSDSKILEMLLKAGGDANAAAANGDTPLCHAADDGTVKNVELLLKAGADVNAVCNSRNTALSEAVGDGDAAKTTLLLKAGADVNQRDSTNETALHRAAELSDATVATMLIAAGAELDAKNRSGATPLFEAIESDSAATVKALLDAGANPNTKTSAGFTPLYEATRFNHPKLIPLLLAAGADPAVKYDGKSMLQVAREEKNAESIALLENAKAVKPAAAPAKPPKPAGDPVAQLKKMGIHTPDEAALFERVRAHDARAVGLLIAAGVKTSARDPFGRPPLYDAVENKDLETVRVLLAAGADPNDPGKHVRAEFESGATLVMVAVDSGELEILRALLDAGAKPDTGNMYAMNALMSACMFGKAEMVQALVDAKANVNAVNSAGTPVLWMAVKGGSAEAVETLLAAGAKLGKNRKLIVDQAAESGNPRIRELIANAAGTSIAAKAPPPLPASKKKWVTAKEMWDLALPLARKWEVDADLNELTTLRGADLDVEGRSHNWLASFYSPSAQKIFQVTYDDGKVTTFDHPTNRLGVISVNASTLFDTRKLNAMADEAGASKLTSRGIRPTVGLINNPVAGPSWYFNYSDPETKRNVGTVVISAVSGRIVLNDVK
ncbi:MAG TPA: ankyrin repeat domain-containing protein [Thermoanaerobaculia bacterium]|nr:ankyrin repeat domain-containing protein [Thermoanaerobaculia bacterium]